MDNKNQPAFPKQKQIMGSGEDYHEIPAAPGLSKRELFAAMALQGMLAKSHAIDGMTEHEVNSITADAVMFADELLTRLEG